MAATHDPDAPSSATYPSPAASVLAATTTTQSRSTFERGHPSRMRSLDAEIVGFRKLTSEIARYWRGRSK